MPDSPVGLSVATDPRSFGERIRRYRQARGMTQAVLAATVGRGHSMLAQIENGNRQIHADEIVTFAQALNVPPSALLGSDEGDLYAEGYAAGWVAAMEHVRMTTEEPIEHVGRARQKVADA